MPAPSLRRLLPNSRLRLVAGFLVLSLGSLLTLAVLTTTVADRVIVQQANDRVSGTAEQTGLYVSQVISGEAALVSSYGRRAYVAEAAAGGAAVSTLSGVNPVLVDLASSGGLRGVTLLRADGTTVDTVAGGPSASSATPVQARVPLARAFARVISDGTVAVDAGAAGDGVLVIAVPVPTVTGSTRPPAGVLAVTYRLDALRTSLDDFAQTQTLGITIVDGSGRTVLSSAGGPATAPGTAEMSAGAPVPTLGWRVTTRVAASVVNRGSTDLRDASITVTVALAALCVLGVRILNRALRQRQESERKLEHMALHDALTGLPNRLLFADRLERALSLAQRSGRSLAIVAVDLNDFKLVNDTLGHQQGDLYLRALAGRLRATLRESDTAARMGGDEFAVLALDIARSGVAELTSRLEAALSESWAFDGHRLGSGASVGVAVFPDDGRSADDLMRCADLAMYEAKRQRTPPQRAPSGEATAFAAEPDLEAVGDGEVTATGRQATEAAALPVRLRTPAA